MRSRAMRARRTVTGAALLAAGLLESATLEAGEIRVHGLLEVAAAERGAGFDLNVLTRDDSPFDAYGLRVFADAQASARLQVFSQFVLRDATTPYVDGAYLMFTPSPARDLSLLAGKVPWAIGTYAPRTYSNRNPLVGAPLMYQYHTTLVWYRIPPNADALLATAGSGQYGIDYAGSYGGRGMALVDDSYWDVGATITGSQRPLEYAIGVVSGTPGWASTAQDENSGKTMLGRAGLLPWPGIRAGVSGAYGPYLNDALNPALPAGRTASDYHQRLAMADLEVETAHVEIRGEGAWNVWETPTVGDLHVTSGYVEAKYSLSFGAFLAGRWDAMRFGKIADSAGLRRPWDADVTRLETGIGYRFSRDAQAKLVYQHTKLEVEGPPVRYMRPSMVAAQVSVSF